MQSFVANLLFFTSPIVKYVYNITAQGHVTRIDKRFINEAMRAGPYSSINTMLWAVSKYVTSYVHVLCSHYGYTNGAPKRDNWVGSRRWVGRGGVKQ